MRCSKHSESFFQQAGLFLTVSDAPNRNHYSPSGTSFLPITDAPTTLNSRRKLMEKWKCTCSAARQREVLYPVICNRRLTVIG
jgi:hypothetical protein